MKSTMKKNDTNHSSVDEDSKIKSQMEKIVNSYDSYMKKITLGREKSLRRMTVNLAQVKSGDCVLEVGCGTVSEKPHKPGWKLHFNQGALRISLSQKISLMLQ